ncbi:MAG: SMC-Scp complex subunit ScpB [Chloroflexi bacterium]|nr:SMC-Scp complex subunit ScpB [Chloroflexota bacterium]
MEPPLELPLQARLEALLFVSPGPVTPAQLAAALEIPAAEVESALQALESWYRENRCGLRVQQHHGRVQLTTAPQAAAVIERFLGLEASSRLSRAALEPLAIIAYQQPVTRPQVDAIRGVNSDGVMKSLLSKGLIQEVGRAEAPGRPILYSTTTDFLQHFGLNSLEELPPLDSGPESSDAAGEEAAPEILKG